MSSSPLSDPKTARSSSAAHRYYRIVELASRRFQAWKVRHSDIAISEMGDVGMGIVAMTWYEASLMGCLHSVVRCPAAMVVAALRAMALIIISATERPCSGA